MYYTEEDRKKPISHYVDGLTFTSCIDLSCGINITSEEGYLPTKEQLAQQVMEFTSWWILNFHSHLNGFSGLDCVSITCNFDIKDQ